jgi:hypothetical protein
VLRISSAERSTNRCVFGDLCVRLLSIRLLLCRAKPRRSCSAFDCSRPRRPSSPRFRSHPHLHPSPHLTLSRSHALTLSRSYALTLLRSHALTLLRSHALTLSRSYALTLLRSHALTLSRSYALTLSRSQKGLNGIVIRLPAPPERVLAAALERPRQIPATAQAQPLLYPRQRHCRLGAQFLS